MTPHEQKILSRAEKFVESLAYWISPEGEIYNVPTRHTDFILSNPELFGLTVEDAMNYKKSLDIQAKREDKDLESQMVRKGWIRMRQYTTRNNQGWTIEVYRVDGKTLDNLFDFVATVFEFRKLKTGVYPKYIDVKDFSQVKIISVHRYEKTKDWNQAIYYHTDFNEIIQGTGELFEKRNIDIDKKELIHLVDFKSFYQI